MKAKFLTLDQIDPAEAWQPWQPTAADPWGRKWAAHLYRRAAFGSSREDILEAERLGPRGTLDLLCEGRPHATEVLKTLVDVGRIAVDGEQKSADEFAAAQAATAASSSAAGGSTACSRAATRSARR